MEKDRVCIVGFNCLNIVNHIKKFPNEGEEESFSKQVWVRGGSAVIGTVLSKLGIFAEFLGTLADDDHLKFFRQDMRENGVQYVNCPIVKDVKSCVSFVLQNDKNGKITIFQDQRSTLPELSFDQFSSIHLNNYKWIHFEGRNEIEVTKMLTYIKKYNDESRPASALSQISNIRSQNRGNESFASFDNNNNNNESNFSLDDSVFFNFVNPPPNHTTVIPKYQGKKLPVSLEIGKSKDMILNILPLFSVDVLFIRKDYALSKDWKNMFDAVTQTLKLNSIYNGTLVICNWEEKGAVYLIKGSKDPIKKVEACYPHAIVDSLGVGETFNSGVIFGLIRGWTPEKAINFGCWLAGVKSGMNGFTDLDEKVKKIPKFKNDFQ